MSKKQPLKSGEKILFVIFGAFFILAMIAYAALETMRLTSDKPMFAETTHFDFSEEGKIGSKIYREARCNSCHRALRTGTSMGLSLDGLGSRHTIDWISAFLANPEVTYLSESEGTYKSDTLDHGPRPKEAAYVSEMSKEDLKSIAVFLSELRADAGSSVSSSPPPEHSAFIDSMVKTWAPDEWKEKYVDIRDRPAAVMNPNAKPEPTIEQNRE